MKQTLYVATHKECWHSVFLEYVQIHVGAAIAERTIEILRDDDGPSISRKNKNYCELTGLYWIWKNDCVSDIVGLCHYRRYFAFKKRHNIFLREMTASEKNGKEIDKFIQPKCVGKHVKKRMIIVPTRTYVNQTIEDHYCRCHIPENWAVMKEVVIQLHPQYKGSMEAVFKRTWLYACNMFVMSKVDFDDYMEWLFSILEEVEQRISISDDVYQARVFGFLAERLFNLYIYHHKFSVKEVPVLFVECNDVAEIRYTHKGMKRMLREWFCIN